MLRCLLNRVSSSLSSFCGGIHALSQDRALSGLLSCVDLTHLLLLLIVDKYVVELAKSGRSTCSECEQYIHQGTVRFGTWFSVMGHDSVKWKHIECVSERQIGNIYRQGLKAEDIDGYDELSSKESRAVDQALEIPEDPAQKFAFLLRLKSVDELKEMAREAGCKVSGTKDELRKRVSDHFARLDHDKEEEEEEEEEEVPARKKGSGRSSPKGSYKRSPKAPDTPRLFTERSKSRQTSPEASLTKGKGTKRKASSKKKRSEPALDFDQEAAADAKTESEGEYEESGRIKRSRSSRKRPSRYDDF